MPRALNPDHRGREGQKPDRHPFAKPPAGEFDRRGAQAKGRPFGGKAEDRTGQKPQKGGKNRFLEELQKGRQIHRHLRFPGLRPWGAGCP